MAGGVFFIGCALWNNHKQATRDKNDLGWARLEYDQRELDIREEEIRLGSNGSDDESLLSDDDNDLLSLLDL